MKKQILSILLATIPAIIFAQCIQDKNSNLKYPTSIDTWKSGDVFDNEKTDKGLGTTIYYNTPGLKATLYIYDNQLTTITSSNVEKEFINISEEIKQVAALGYYKITSPIKTLPDEKIGVISVKHSSYEYDQKGEIYVSHSYLCNIKNNFIKIRISFYKSDFDKAKPIMDSFIKDLINSIVTCSAK